MSRPALIVLAKAPVAGRSKTRLCPPLTPDEAAALAEAALLDTLAAVAALADVRAVLVLEGLPGPWLPAGTEVVAQVGGGLGDRLAGAFEAVGEPALLVGMDTPQVSPALLDAGLQLLDDGAEALLGPALDGGFWAVGLGARCPAAFHGVPMSTSSTGATQRRRLEALGLEVAELPPLRDVDVFADALEVAAGAPGSRFAAALAGLELTGSSR